jgi:hypothetical protein
MPAPAQCPHQRETRRRLGGLGCKALRLGRDRQGGTGQDASTKPHAGDVLYPVLHAKTRQKHGRPLKHHAEQ